MNKLLLGTAVLGLGLLAGCGSSPDDADPETKSISFDGSTLEIETDNGDVEVESGDVDEIEVTRWFTGDSDEGTWDMEENTLTFEADCGWFSNCEGKYRVVVPDDLALDVEGDNSKVIIRDISEAIAVDTDNGEIVVTGSTGDIELETDNGDQEVSSSAPDRMRSQTSNGDVEIDLDEPPSELVALADNGSIEITLPGDVSYDVETAEDNGDVENELDVDSDSPHKVRVEVENGEAELSPAD